MRACFLHVCVSLSYCFSLLTYTISASKNNLSKTIADSRVIKCPLHRRRYKSVDNMDVSLVASQRIVFTNKSQSNSYFDTVHNMSGMAKVEYGMGCSGSYSSMLEKSLAKTCSLLKVKCRPIRGNQQRGLNLTAELVFQKPSSTNNDGLSYIKLFNEVNEDNFFTRLERACGGFANVTFQMDWILRPTTLDNMKLEAKGLRVETNVWKTFNRIEHEFKITEEDFEKLKGVSQVDGELTLRLRLTDAALQALQMDNLEDALCANRALRADVGSTDALIIARGGAKIRCHRGFLSAHSAVFKAMFESSMKEGTTGIVELHDMSEAAVQALLDYLHFWDIEGSCKNSSVALELLVAADKYNIPRLQNSIQDMMLLKETGWFTVSGAIQLPRFAKKMRSLTEEDEAEDSDQVYKSLETKSVAVLKSKSADELNECPEYEKDPKMAKEFCTYLAIYPANN